MLRLVSSPSGDGRAPTFGVGVFLQAEGDGSGGEHTGGRGPSGATLSRASAFPIVVLAAPAGECGPRAPAALQVVEPPRGEVVVLHVRGHIRRASLLA